MNLKTFYRLSKKPLSQPLRLTSSQLIVKPHPCVRSFLDKVIPISFISAQINPYAQVFILGSAEANALTSGLLAWQKGRLKFLPARLHAGPNRSLDTAVACFQAFQLPAVVKMLKSLSSFEKQLALVDLLREGQKTQVPETIYYLYQKLPANLLLSIHHIPDKTTPLGRKANFALPNFEGINLKTTTTLILSDPIAGGVNQFYAINYFLKKLPKLKQLIIIAPHLPQYSAVALARFLEKVKLKTIFLGYGALLNSKPPDMYFSPTPVNQPEKFANPKHAKILKFFYGEAAASLCVGGNWTAMFLAPRVGLEWFEKELREINFSLSKIKNKKLGLAQLKNMGFSLKELVPASSYLDAVNADQLSQLKEKLRTTKEKK